jgi:hypothetical protein
LFGMRRDVADGCGANKMWISGEPGRVSSGSGELGANLGEERRALVVDQERSATSSTSFRPKLLRVASYLGWEKAEKRPRVARESCSGGRRKICQAKMGWHWWQRDCSVAEGLFWTGARAAPALLQFSAKTILGQRRGEEWLGSAQGFRSAPRSGVSTRPC